MIHEQPPGYKLTLTLTLLCLAGALFFMLPAFFNGYPLVNSDVGTYLSSGFKLEQPGDRPITYGLFLRVFSLDGYTLWLPLAAQALTASWLILTLIRRLYGDRHIAWRSLVAFSMLTLTSFSWTMSEIIPDIWTGIAVLIAVLIILDKERLPVRIFLYVVYFSAIATHASHIMIFTLLILFVLLFGPLLSRYRNRRRLSLNLLVLLLVTWSSMFTTIKVAQQSRHVFLLASLLEKGVLKVYLDESCKENNYEICRYKDGLIEDPNYFMWDEKSPLYRQGGWESTRGEYTRIANDALSKPRYIGLFAKAAFAASVKQLYTCNLAEGNYPFPAPGHIYSAIERYASRDTAAYSGAWQQEVTIPEHLSAMNNIHYVLAILGVLLLFLLYASPRIDPSVRLVVLILVAGYLINVADCATFAQVNARYGSRMIWVLPFAAQLLLFQTGFRGPFRSLRASKDSVK